MDCVTAEYAVVSNLFDWLYPLRGYVWKVLRLRLRVEKFFWGLKIVILVFSRDSEILAFEKGHLVSVVLGVGG